MHFIQSCLLFNPFLYDLPHIPAACFQVVARWKTGATFIGLLSGQLNLKQLGWTLGTLGEPLGHVARWLNSGYETMRFQMKGKKQTQKAWGIFLQELESHGTQELNCYHPYIYIYIDIFSTCVHNMCITVYIYIYTYIYGTVYVHHFITNRLLSEVQGRMRCSLEKPTNHIVRSHKPEPSSYPWHLCHPPKWWNPCLCQRSPVQTKHTKQKPGKVRFCWTVLVILYTIITIIVILVVIVIIMVADIVCWLEMMIYIRSEKENHCKGLAGSFASNVFPNFSTSSNRPKLQEGFKPQLRITSYHHLNL